MEYRIRRLLQVIGVMAISFAIFSTPSVALADDTFIEYDGNGTELSLSFMPADSDEAMATSDNSRTSSTTGVTIGTGFLAARQVSVDQTDVYNKALTRVKYWRQDALNSGVKIKYNGSFVTISDALGKMGISKNEYLSPSWSNALERIALQRSIEAGDVNIGHTRPDGTSCFTATYNGASSFGEILAWNNGDITNAIDNWASEKSAYIKYTNGEAVDQNSYGHYLTLVNPSNKAFGFAKGSPGCYNGYRLGYTFVGEAASSALGGSSPTNIKGTNWFEVTMSTAYEEKYGLYASLPDGGYCVGGTYAFKIWSGYDSRAYCLGGYVSKVQDSSILSIVNDGFGVKALKRGSTSFRYSDDVGNYFTIDVTVREFSDVYSDTAHLDDINWLADSGISTGWPDEESGTKSFQPYSNVIRADMAAFLYRLAGSPSYTAPSKSPFKDVTSSTPHYKEICWLASTGVSTGWSVSGGKEFRPFSPVVRADMAAFLYRLAGSPSYSVPSASPFKDCSASNTPHYKEVCWLASTGVSTGWSVSGGKEFRPFSSVVRADMAAFLHRMKDKGLV